MSDTEEPPKRESIFTDEQLAEIEETFQVFDRDGDSKINKSEIEALLPSIGLPFQQDELDDFCARLDQTGTGLFNFDEFLQVAEKFRAQIDMREQITKAFQAFLNRPDDSHMTDSLLIKILQAGGNPFTPDEVKQLRWALHDGDPGDFDDFEIPAFIDKLVGVKEEPETED